MTETAVRLLEQVVGEEHLLADEQVQAFRADGAAPQGVVFPGSEEEVAAVLRIASEAKLAVVPWGGGTRIHIGNPPTRYDLAVSLRRLDRVVDYQPDDMVITAQAGVSLLTLEETTRAAGQFLPLDLRSPDQATLGGSVASNANGSLRFGFRNSRDLILGAQLALPGGSLVTGGSAMMKDVAGYDFVRLYVGSYGSLGIFTRLIAQVFPLPEQRETVVAGFETAEGAARGLEWVMGSRLLPTIVDLLDPPMIDRLPADTPVIPGLFTIVLGSDGAEETVRWQTERLQRGLVDQECSAVSVLRGEDALVLRRRLPDLADQPEALLSCKVSLLPTNVIPFLQQAAQEAQAAGLQTACAGQAGNGILRLHFFADNAKPPIERLQLLVTHLAQMVQGKGSLVIERAPLEFKQTTDVWVTSAPSLSLMRGLKQRLDPNGIMSPGRFVGRL